MALLPLFAMVAAAAVAPLGRCTSRLTDVPRWAITLAGIAPLIVLMISR